jgi:hypothetical protein
LRGRPLNKPDYVFKMFDKVHSMVWPNGRAEARRGKPIQHVTERSFRRRLRHVVRPHGHSFAFSGSRADRGKFVGGVLAAGSSGDLEPSQSLSPVGRTTAAGQVTQAKAVLS